MPVNRRLLALLALVVALAALAVSAPAAATGDATRCTLGAVLKGENEVPATTSKALAAAVVHINGTKLSFAVAIANPARETFTRGHIHVGAAGANGGIVVALFEGARTTGSSSSRPRASTSPRTSPRGSAAIRPGSTSTTTRPSSPEERSGGS